MTKENNVITPRLAKSALAHLPYRWAVMTKELLDKWEKEGKIEKTYSKSYIDKVKNKENYFNAEVMEAIVAVGLENKKLKAKFGITKKASKEN